MPDEVYAYDLLKNSIRNDTVKGAAFRSYYSFLSRVAEAGTTPSKFYVALPPAGRAVVNPETGLSLGDVQRLFSTFAQEFLQTYGLD